MFANTRGFSLLSLALVLCVAGFLYLGFVGLDRVSDESITTIAEAHDAGSTLACHMNKRTIEQSLFSWKINHPDQVATLDSLDSSGFHVPRCPAGGSYELNDDRVSCDLHDK